MAKVIEMPTRKPAASAFVPAEQVHSYLCLLTIGKQRFDMQVTINITKASRGPGRVIPISTDNSSAAKISAAESCH
jgi:hypothetical protein